MSSLGTAVATALSYLSTYSGLSHDFLTRHDIQSILNFSQLAGRADNDSFSSMSALVMRYRETETTDTA